MGLKQALMWLMNISFSKASIELDSKLVIDGMAGRPSHRTEGIVLYWLVRQSCILYQTFG